jgi:hypothetical protein
VNNQSTPASVDKPATSVIEQRIRNRMIESLEFAVIELRGRMPEDRQGG